MSMVKLHCTIRCKLLLVDEIDKIDHSDYDIKWSTFYENNTCIIITDWTRTVLNFCKLLFYKMWNFLSFKLIS